MNNIPALDGEPQAWWSALPNYQSSLIRSFLESGATEEEAAALWLSRTGPDNNFPFGGSADGKNFLSNVQSEFRKFLCGDPSYDDLRGQALTVWTGARLPIVATVAAGIGATVGVAAAVIMPVVALLLAAATKIGLNAWCATES